MKYKYTRKEIADMYYGNFLIIKDLLAQKEDRKECKHCKGTGRIYDGNTHTWSGTNDCHDCRGTGKELPTPSPLEIEEIEEMNEEETNYLPFITNKVNTLIRNQKKLYQYIKKI